VVGVEVAERGAVGREAGVAETGVESKVVVMIGITVPVSCAPGIDDVSPPKKSVLVCW